MNHFLKLVFLVYCNFLIHSSFSQKTDSFKVNLEINEDNLFLYLNFIANYTFIDSNYYEFSLFENDKVILNNISKLYFHNGEANKTLNLKESGLMEGNYNLTVKVSRIIDKRNLALEMFSETFHVKIPKLYIYNINIGDYYITELNSDVSARKVLTNSDKKNADPFMVLSSQKMGNIHKTNYKRNSTIANGFSIQFISTKEDVFELSIMDQDNFSRNDKIDYFVIPNVDVSNGTLKGKYKIDYSIYALPNNFEEDVSFKYSDTIINGLSGKLFSYENKIKKNELSYKLNFKNIENKIVYSLPISSNGETVFVPNVDLLDVRKVEVEKMAYIQNTKYVFSSISKDCWVEKAGSQINITKLKFKTGKIKNSYKSTTGNFTDYGVMVSYKVDLPLEYLNSRYKYNDVLGIELSTWFKTESEKEVVYSKNIPNNNKTSILVKESFPYSVLDVKNGKEDFQILIRPSFEKEYFDTIFHFKDKIEVKNVKRYRISIKESELLDTINDKNLNIKIANNFVGALSSKENSSIDITVCDDAYIVFQIIGNYNLPENLFYINAIENGILKLPISNVLGNHFKKLTLEITEL